MNGVANANPSVGKQVLMSPFSGPSGSPFDAKKANYSNPNNMTRDADVTNLSTGALSTGIGFGLNNFDGFVNLQPGRVLPDPNFTDDYTPGVTLPGGTAATTAILTAIGGGKVVVSGAGNDIYTLTPYVALPLLAFGGGGSRDATTGKGFGTKMVTAVATVAVAGVVETDFVNRTSFSIGSGKSIFGSSTVASPAVT